jgi:hypothetical protein
MSEGKKIEIEIPEGYKLVQDGMKFEFVKKDERFLSWEEKDSKLTGYRVSSASDVYSVDNYDRNDTTMNIFATEAQAMFTSKNFSASSLVFKAKKRGMSRKQPTAKICFLPKKLL